MIVVPCGVIVVHGGVLVVLSHVSCVVVPCGVSCVVHDGK